MWREKRDAPSAISTPGILRKAEEFLAPMFGDGLTISNRSAPVVNIVVIEQRISGCHLEFAQNDHETSVQAIEYPLNARTVLKSRIPHLPELVLPGLCRELERSPEALLKELAPPFSLGMWIDP